jgi:hypothetical protein
MVGDDRVGSELNVRGMGALHDQLHGGLWHTTRPDRVPSIVSCGSIMVEPHIDEKERWGSRDRPPFVRKIGGISLFDFDDFDPENYAVSHPLSSWQYFVPHRDDWGGAVWLNIDRAAVSNSFISPDEIVGRWDVTGNRGHNVMPRIEAAHLGNLPISAIRSAFLTWDGGREIRVFDIQNFDAVHFEGIVGEWHMAIGKGRER